MHDISQAIDEAPSWSEALHTVLRRICETEDWQVGHVYVPAADVPTDLIAVVSYSAGERCAPFQAASWRIRHVRGRSLPGRVFDDGQYVWVNDQETLLRHLPVRAEAAAQCGLRSAVALPVRIESHTLAVVELCSDRPHPESAEFVRLMHDVTLQLGHVIERERSMLQMGELIWGEQQDLVHTLHDALGQQLTGLGMLASSLIKRLGASGREAAQTARQIATSAQDALE